MSLTSSNRLPSLDGLRTISIFLVIVSHASFYFGYTGIFNIGDLGVRIFFVISGFLITGLLVREVDETNKINLLRFYFRRTLRIFPPYYFFLAVFACLAIFGKIKIALAAFLPVFTYTSDYFFPGDWNFDHAWSLSVEEQFYLIYPGLLFLCGRRKSEILLVLTLLICPIVRFIDHGLFGQLHPIWLTKGFDANLDTLAIGCLLAMRRTWLHEKQWYRQILASKLMYLAPLAIFLINTEIDYENLDLGILFSINNVLIVLMIDWAVTHFDNAAGRVLNSAPFVTIGVMSYSIYLWQQPFLNPEPSSKYFAFPYNLLGFAVFVGISYFVVEKMSMRFRKRYEEGLLERQSKKTLTVGTAEA